MSIITATANRNFKKTWKQTAARSNQGMGAKARCKKKKKRDATTVVNLRQFPERHGLYPFLLLFCVAWTAEQISFILVLFPFTQICIFIYLDQGEPGCYSMTRGRGRSSPKGLNFYLFLAQNVTPRGTCSIRFC